MENNEALFTGKQTNKRNTMRRPFSDRHNNGIRDTSNRHADGLIQGPHTSKPPDGLMQVTPYQNADKRT